MKVRIQIICSILFFLSCVGTVTAQKIEGKINFPFKELKLTYGMNHYEISYDSIGNYSLSLNKVEEGVYSFLIDRNTVYVYLKPSTELTLDFNQTEITGNFYETISVVGLDIDYTKLLIDYEKEKNEKFSINKPELYKKAPNEFEIAINERLDNVLQWIDDFVKVKKIRDNTLISFFKQKELAASHYLFYYYPNDHRRYAPEHNDKTPELFRDYYNERIVLNDELAYNGDWYYGMFVRTHYNSLVSEKLKEYDISSLEYQKKRVEVMQEINFPDYMRNDMYTVFIITYMKSTDAQIKNYLKDIIEKNVHSGVLFERWKEFLIKDSKFSNGEQAPPFSYPDINGNIVSLSDFKGNLVYIDLWATWCGPCLKELPNLKELKEKYKDSDIVFIGISLDDNVEAWRKMIQKESDNLLTGIQLATGSYNSQINKDYSVNGIPHCILIGKDGKIIAKKAPRPSSSEIIQLIDSNL